METKTQVKVEPKLPEPETPGAYGAIFLRVEAMANGTYQIAFTNALPGILDAMRPGDWVEIRKLEKR